MRIQSWFWLVVFILVPPYALAVESLYSDLSSKACKAVGQSEANYMSGSNCPGVLGYTLQINTEDDRESITLLGGGHEQPLDFYGHVTTTFNYLGDKAEWRVRDGKPIALIVRMYFSDQETNKKEQRLIVAKVRPSGSCVTQVINATKVPNANEQAREAADHAADQKCLWAS